MTDTPDPDRRRLLGIAGGAIGSALLPLEAIAQQARSKSGAPPRPLTDAVPAPAAPAPGLKFFSKSEFALLDEIAETIVPADEVSGGARAAKVAEYLDARVAESIDPAFKLGWRQDLAEIERMAVQITGRPFLAQTPAQRARFMDRISRNEAKPKENVEFSFHTIKWQVTFTYYKTRIGIHDDLKYQGNVIIDEFVGTDPSRA